MSPRSLFDPTGFLSQQDAEALTKRVLGMAKAEQTRVTVIGTTRGNTRYAVNQVSSGGDTANITVSIRSTFGTRSASTTTNKLDDASLKSAVDMSERLAKLAPEDPEFMPELDPQTYDTSPGWSAVTASLDPAGRAAAVRAVTEPSRAAKLAATGYIESECAGERDREQQGTVRIRTVHRRFNDHDRSCAGRQCERMGWCIAL